MSVDDTYTKLDKARKDILKNLLEGRPSPPHGYDGNLSAQELDAYLAAILPIIKEVKKEEIDPARPLLDLSKFCLNIDAFPEGIYPGINFIGCFFQTTANKIIRFKNVVINGPLQLTGVSATKNGNYIAFSFDRCKVMGKFQAMMPHNEIVITNCHFAEAIFLNCLIKQLSDTNFHGSAKFLSRTQFLSHTISGVVFEHDCYFSQVGSEGALFPVGLICTRSSSGQQTEFRRKAVFDDVNFIGPVNLSGVPFSEASFRNCSFRKEADFSGVIFKGLADFSNATFHAATNFSHVQFTNAPMFHEATLHSNTYFTNAKYGHHRSEEDWRAYRTLREKMGSRQATVEESEFFVHEQRALAMVELRSRRATNLVSALLALFYWTCSRFGASMMLPFFWLVIVNGGAYCFYTLAGGVAASKEYRGGGWIIDLSPAQGLMWQNLINPFGFFGREIPFTIETLEVARFSAMQSLISIALFTLFVLAIRRRFRKTSE